MALLALPVFFSHYTVMTYPGYFDWAATSPISPAALETYYRTAGTYYGNPSSVHEAGLQARNCLNQARSTCARLLEVSPSSLTFTSGGSESNAIVLGSLLWNKTPGSIIIPWFEHPSVARWEPVLAEKGWNVVRIPASGGYVSPDSIAASIDSSTRMVVCMLVNNILGTVQDVAGIVRSVREAEKRFGRKIHVHCDCVQAIGKTVFSLPQLGVDSASFSAHKFRGPRGVGILYSTSSSLRALSRGGNQEAGLRPGTENLAGIASMVEALKETMVDIPAKLEAARVLRRFMEKKLQDDAPQIVRISPSIDGPTEVTPYIMEISVTDIPSEVFTRRLSQEGFAVSAGSACSNNAKQDTGVLDYMGLPLKDVGSPIRISFGQDTTEDDVHKLMDTIVSIYNGERSLLGYARKK